MRYRDSGAIHRDFHLSTNITIEYVLKEFGEDFLEELFRRTAQNVYQDIYVNLKRGDYKPLLEHWTYYYTREEGEFCITEMEDGICFHVKDCPAVKHLVNNDVLVSDHFLLQISLLNKAWSEGTPFCIETEIIKKSEYKMIIRRRQNDTQ